jgi:hypothetical protein
MRDGGCGSIAKAEWKQDAIFLPEDVTRGRGWRGDGRRETAAGECADGRVGRACRGSGGRDCL